MSIVVTPGETALIEAFSKKAIPIETKNLLVGDIHICKGETPVYIIERKAKGDLAASIKDGRYHEQKSRLFQTGVPRENIIYLIENLKEPDNAVWGAICNTQYRDKCTVFQTRSTNESVDYLVHLAKSVDKFYENAGAPPIETNIKKQSCSPEDWFTHCLTLIPKVSKNVATVIVQKYPKFTDLKSAIKTDGSKAISELKFGASQRRIGDKLAGEICQFINLNY